MQINNISNRVKGFLIRGSGVRIPSGAPAFRHFSRLIPYNHTLQKLLNNGGKSSVGSLNWQTFGKLNTGGNHGY